MRIAIVIVVGRYRVVVFWAGRRGSSRGRGIEAHMYCPCLSMFDVFVLAGLAVDWLRLLFFVLAQGWLFSEAVERKRWRWICFGPVM